MTPGDLTLTIMDAIRVELGEQLAGSVGGSTCYTGLYPVSLAVADWCNCRPNRAGTTGCGMAWTRLDRAFPSSAFPAVDTAGICTTKLAAVIEVGVYRCLPSLDANGVPPTAAEQAAAVQTQLADLDAMRCAIASCEEVSERRHVLGAYTPRDSGGCGGGLWSLTVELSRRPARS